VTESTTKARSRSVVSGLVLAVPIAAAALASATLLGGAPTAAHESASKNATCVSLLCTTAATGATDPKIPEGVGD
jgi:hypothetical protein